MGEREFLPRPEQRQNRGDTIIKEFNDSLRFTKQMLASLALAVELFSACAPAQMQVRDEASEGGEPDDAVKEREGLKAAIRKFEDDIARKNREMPPVDRSRVLPAEGFDLQGMLYETGETMFWNLLRGLNDGLERSTSGQIASISVSGLDRANIRTDVKTDDPDVTRMVLKSVGACQGIQVTLRTGEFLEEPCDGKFRDWRALYFIVVDLAHIAEAKFALETLEQRMR